MIFSILGILDIVTNLIDQFILTSNLELLLINNLLSVGLYFIFFLAVKNITISRTKLTTLYTLLLTYAFILFSQDWPKTNIDLYSKYGYLNTLEYSNFCFASAIICLILCTKTTIKIVKSDTPSLNIIFIISGIAIYNIGALAEFGMGAYFITESHSHNEFLNLLIPMRLYTSKCFILIGLIWKN